MIDNDDISDVAADFNRLKLLTGAEDHTVIDLMAFIHNLGVETECSLAERILSWPEMN